MRNRTVRVESWNVRVDSWKVRLFPSQVDLGDWKAISMWLSRAQGVSLR
jgi:hypothetical protein